LRPAAPYPLAALALLGILHLQPVLGQNPAPDPDAARRIPTPAPIVKVVPLSITRQITVAKTPAPPGQDPAVRGLWNQPSPPPAQPNLRDEGDVDPTLQQDLQTFSLGPSQTHLFSIAQTRPSMLVVHALLVGASAGPTLTLTQGGKPIGQTSLLSLPPDRVEITSSVPSGPVGTFNGILTNTSSATVQVTLVIVHAAQPPVRKQP
jgi:hypothetical protein